MTNIEILNQFASNWKPKATIHKRYIEFTPHFVFEEYDENGKNAKLLLTTDHSPLKELVHARKGNYLRLVVKI